MPIIGAATAVGRRAAAVRHLSAVLRGITHLGLTHAADIRGTAPAARCRRLARSTRQGAAAPVAYLTAILSTRFAGRRRTALVLVTALIGQTACRSTIERAAASIRTRSTLQSELFATLGHTALASVVDAHFALHAVSTVGCLARTEVANRLTALSPHRTRQRRLRSAADVVAADERSFAGAAVQRAATPVRNLPTLVPESIAGRPMALGTRMADDIADETIRASTAVDRRPATVRDRPALTCAADSRSARLALVRGSTADLTCRAGPTIE